MKQFKYILALALSVIVIAMPIGAVVTAVYLYIQYEQGWILAVGAVVCAVCFMLNSVVREFRVNTRQDSQTDQYGDNKLAQYKYLSQEERNKVDLLKTASRENLVSSVMLKKMTQQGPKNPEEVLNGMIGLEPTKEAVMEMVARMKFETEENKNKKKGERQKLSGRHMVFFGSPGTGKTTVARIITGFLYQYGYIKENKCIEIDGNFLKAGTESAMKTELVLREVYGGVLFIDEAYALMDSSDNSGQQVIATLIKQMEDNRDKFILILAGYTNEMKQLIAANPGFESRLKDFLYFPDYNCVEMREILQYMARGQNFVIDEGAYDIYDSIIYKERNLKSFGNARTVRNVLDKAIDKHSLNLHKGLIEPENRYRLMKIDFQGLKLGGISVGMEGI